MKSAKYAGLNVLERVPAEASRAIILLHGFGADGADLSSLADAVDLSATPTGSPAWFFPTGPHSVPIGPHMVGRAWFPLRLAELRERGVDFSLEMPPGMEQAVSTATKAIEAICSGRNLRLEDVVIGGFSQGAMVALEVALELASRGHRVAGLTLFSSTLVAEPSLRDRLSLLKNIRFVQSHGMLDFVLPYALAERLEQVLVESGLDGMLLSFRGGHEIPLPVLREWQSWLQGQT